MRKVLLILVLAAGGQACAHGYTGFSGFSIPGFEAVGVAASNSALVNALAYQAVQPGWIYHGQPTGYAPAGYQWVCQPVSLVHKLEDAGLAALVGGSFLGWRGAGAGAGGAGYIVNHEKDCYLLKQPAIQQPAMQQPVLGLPSQAPQSQPLVVEATPSRLAGVQFVVINENPGTIVVEIPDGRRAVLEPRARTRVRTPDIKVFLVQRDDVTGSFNEVEVDLRTLQDESLPGWRIPAKVRLKAP